MASSSSSSSSSLRVLCLTRGALDAICALGLQDCLVGRTHECTEPPSVLNLPCFSSCENSSSRKLGLSLNWELLKDLKPDVIFTQNQINSDDADFHRLINCRVVYLQSSTVEDIFHNLETIAQYCGVGKEGEKLVSALQLKWKRIKQKTPQWADGMPRVNVACISCANPLTSSGYWIPEIISSAGGWSLCSKIGYPNESMTLKDLVGSDPDAIVYLCRGLHFGIIARELSRLVTSNEWRKIKAIKANRFFVIDSNKFFIDSAPNVVLSTEIMAEILHGFDYGHAGKGFLRWTDPSVTKQWRAHENQFQSIPESCPNAHDHSKYVTKMPVFAKGKDEVVETINKGMLINRAVITEVSNISRSYDVNSTDSSSPCDKWPNPVMEMHSYKPPARLPIRKAVSSLSSFYVCEHEEVKEEEKYAQKVCGSLKQPFISKKIVVSERYLYEQEIISKVWAITQSAAKNRAIIATSLNSKNSIPMKFADVSSISKNERSKLSSGNISVDSFKVDVNKRKKISRSPPLNLVLQGMPKKARLLRNSFLKSLADLQSAECLLLSGGLASSTLSEIVPQVGSKCFKMGFTVLAGPEAMDTAYAGVVAKHKAIDHVIIGDKSKESAILLLAKELPFVVENVKTFDPCQIRGCVPISAALREAKIRGFKCVVTGDGLDELLLRDGPLLTEAQVFQLEVSNILSKSVVLLGEALGIKVIQPFLDPKFVEECKALRPFGAQSFEGARSMWKKAFPEVSYWCKGKNSIEFGSGMHYVTEYFTSAISTFVLANKAKLVHLKERVHIHSTEQLVYYRAFKRIFKGKIPKGMLRWQRDPCSQCGYQLSLDINWYCLVCGHCKAQQGKPSHTREVLQLTLPKELDRGSLPNTTMRMHEESGVEKDSARCGVIITNELRKMASQYHKEAEASVKHDDGEANKKISTKKSNSLLKKGNQCVSRTNNLVGKSTNPKLLPESHQTSADKQNKQRYIALLGAGSAGLLLLLQLSKG